MTIIVTSDGASKSKPGVYPAVKTLNLTGFPLQPTGTVGVIGTSAGGQPMVLDEMSGAAIQAGKLRYKSGPIADSLGLLTTPSKDPRVPNGASKIISVKVNPSTQAASNLANNLAAPATIVSLLTKNWGADENNVSRKVTAGSILDTNATFTGTIAGPFNLAGGETLILVINGTTYTYTNTLIGAAITTAALAADMNTAANWSSSIKPVTCSASGLFVKIIIDTAVVLDGFLEYGYISVTPSSTLDTIVGITGSTRGVRGSRFVFFKKGAVEEASLPEIGGVELFSIVYTGAGTAATMTVQDSLGNRVLTTTCTGAAGDNLNLVLGATEAGELVPKMTVRELIDQINATGKYTVTSSYTNLDINAIELDFYNAVHIENVALSTARDVEDFVQNVNTLSRLAGATRVSNIYGTIAVASSYVFFTGAVDGTASNSDWAAAFELMKKKRVNIVVVLLSADVGAVSIDTVNALADAHALWAWSAEGRSPRNVYVSRLGSKSALKSAAMTMNSGYTSMVVGDTKAFSFGQSKLAFLDPWATACIIAGMQAGAAVGEPTTFKVVNANDIRVRDNTWDPKTDGTEMINAGLTFLEPLDSGGFRVVVGNTTYGKDASFVYNRVSVVQVAGFVYYDLVQNLEAVFTGTKAKTGSASNLANFMKARMEIYLKNEVIVGDDLNKGAGYKDLTVTLGANGNGGNTATIDVTITPVQGLDFILPTIYLADIQQSA